MRVGTSGQRRGTAAATVVTMTTGRLRQPRSARARALALAATAPLALALLACGGADGTSDGGAAAPSTTAPTSAAPGPGATSTGSGGSDDDAGTAPGGSGATTSDPAPTGAEPSSPEGDQVPAYTITETEEETDDGVLEVDLDVDVDQVLTEDQVRALVAELQADRPGDGHYELSVDCGAADDDDDIAEAEWAVGEAALRESGLAQGEVRVELETDARCGTA